MEQYITLEKRVGETPLECLETFRSTRPDLIGIPMAYAGRLDPMASGKLLVLLGEECKRQTGYHDLEKEYEFSVLLGIGSDTHDVLGRLDTKAFDVNRISTELETVLGSLVGAIELPYPHFSAKTVAGKPLHTWTLEGRLDEIEIPTKRSRIHQLELLEIDNLERAELCEQALAKIDSVRPVTEARKALGNDFRRVDVRGDWRSIAVNRNLPDTYRIARIRCICSSGTYMRTLAKVVGEQLGTLGLAWSIHRTKIGRYEPAAGWVQQF